ncbi:MAG TPA: DoxX family protein [Longimicrobiales bacterium]
MERYYPGWGLALLRAVLGLIFLVHGWDKLFGEAGVAGFAQNLASLGFPAPDVLAWAATLVEFLGGLLLIVGWLTRWTAAVIFVEILIATFVSHVQHGFFVYRPEGEWGYEYNLLLLAGLATLVLAGSGKLALDDWLVRRAAG